MRLYRNREFECAKNTLLGDVVGQHGLGATIMVADFRISAASTTLTASSLRAYCSSTKTLDFQLTNTARAITSATLRSSQV